MNKKQDRASRTKAKNKASGKILHTPKAGPKSYTPEAKKPTTK